MKFRETIEIDSNYNPERRIVIYQFAFMDFNIPNEVIDIEDITSSINWATMFGIIIETLFTITKKILFAVVCFYGCAILAIFPLMDSGADTIYVFLVLMAAIIPEVLPWVFFTMGSIHIAIQSLAYLFENFIWP